jgi:hypothetical protein
MKKQEIKCDGCNEKDLLIERLQKQLFELEMKYESLVDKIVESVQPVQPVVQQVLSAIQPVIQPAIQPKAIGGQANDTGSRSQEEPKNYNEKWLNENYDTKIGDFMNQITFDEDEVADLFKNPHNFNRLVLKTLQETVDRTPIKHRGIITTSASRKNIWVLKVNKWEIDTEATLNIKNKLRANVYKILYKFVSDERGILESTPEASIYADIIETYLSKMNKWEDIDNKIMMMFKS